jgi:hypothetical protein
MRMDIVNECGSVVTGMYDGACGYLIHSLHRMWLLPR